MLISATYSAAWVAHSGIAGDWYQPVMQLHRSLGLDRAGGDDLSSGLRGHAQIPKLPDDLHPLQKLAAKGMERCFTCCC